MGHFGSPHRPNVNNIRDPLGSLHKQHRPNVNNTRYNLRTRHIPHRLHVNNKRESHPTHHTPRCETFVISSSKIILWSLLMVVTDGFGQGSMIENSFESTYCREGLSTLSRGPMHYDLRRCGGECQPSRAPRDMYRMVVNATTYSVDAVEVEIRANVRRGANLLGFAVVAITEDGGTAGRWVVDEEAEDPEVLRATCDSLLEGQVIFQARPSNERSSAKFVWNPRKTNYGSVIFRAWVVQSLDSIFVLDSRPLTNPLDGRDFMELETHFSSLLDAMNPGPTSQRRSSPSSLSLSLSSQSQPPSNLPRRKTGEGKRNASRSKASMRGNLGARDNTLSKRNNSTDPGSGRKKIKDFDSASLTMQHFEDAFLTRLSSGFDLSGSDPFSSFKEEVPQMSDLIPTTYDNNSQTTFENLASRTNVPGANNIPGWPGSTASQGRSPSSQGFPSQIPGQQDSRRLPGMASIGLTQPNLPQLPTQFMPSQFPGQQPNMISSFMLAPGNPFSGVRTAPRQNRFQSNVNSPWRNSVPQGFNPASGSQTLIPPQSFPRTNGNFGGSGNIPTGSTPLPGLNAPFLSQNQRPFQPNLNQWAPNWNAGANWRFQNGDRRGFVPNRNPGQNLAGWNRNILGSAPNPLNSNGPNQVSPNVNRNIKTVRPSLNSNNFKESRMTPNVNAPPVQAPRNTRDMNGATTKEGKASPSGLGSFSELLHAAGGWGGQ